MHAVAEKSEASLENASSSPWQQRLVLVTKHINMRPCQLPVYARRPVSRSERELDVLRAGGSTHHAKIG